MRAAVLGSPVEHSLSPLLHRTAYEALGLRGWTYEAHRCEQDELAAFLAGARADDSWRGLSLTMPLKAVGAASCDELVTDLGVINTIIFERGAGPVRLVGHNTDVAGIAAAWRELGVSAERVTLLGAGGTARAAVRALADLGARQVSVHVRTAERARSVVDLARDLGVTATVGSLTALPPGVPVLSTLPPEGARGIDADAPLLDVVYAPWPTPLALSALRRARPVVGGLAVLVAQAAVQVELMTGAPVPPAVAAAMRAAGEHALRS